MSISILPNLALSDENNNVSYGCNTKYNLPCQRGDVYTLQGFLSNANTLDLANGSSFAGWNLATGFSAGGSTLSYDGTGTTGAVAASASLNMIPGNLYMIQINVAVFGLPFLLPGQGVILNINGANIPLPGTTLGQGCNQSFQLTYFYSPTTITGNRLTISTNFATAQFNITQLSVYQMSLPTVVAYDMNDNYVQTLDLNYIKYFNSTPIYAIQSPLPTCRFDIQFPLDELADGCYYLEIYDGAAMPQDPNFATGNGLTLGNYWSRPNGEYLAQYAGSVANTNLLTTNIMVNEFATYTFSFYLSTNANGYNHPGVKVKITFSDGSNYTSALFTTTGYQSFIFTPTAGTGISYATLSFIPILDLSTDVISVSKIFISFTGAQFTSNNISFMTNCPYTHLFAATNNDGAFNFDYSQGLTHSIRLWSKMKYHNYTEDVDQYNFSDNSNILMTASITKLYEVTIGDAAEFVHDCLSMMRLNDEFYIDGNQYVIDGAYALKQRKATELSVATFDVKPLDGISKNWAIE